MFKFFQRTPERLVRRMNAGTFRGTALTSFIATRPGVAGEQHSSPQFCVFSPQEPLGLLASLQLKNSNEGTGFQQLTDKAIAEGNVLVDKICSATPGEEVVRLFDSLSDTLCQVADLAECIRNVHPDDDVCYEAAEACLALHEYVEMLNTNVGLFNALDSTIGTLEVYETLDAVSQRTALSFMHDFKVSGVHLPSEQRKRTVQLHCEALRLGHAFVSRSSAPVQIEGGVTHTNVLKSLPHIDGHPMIDQNIASQLQCHSDEETRSFAFKAYNAIFPEQLKDLEKLISCRHELATTVGYPSFAHMNIQRTMVGSPERLLEFLHMLSDVNLPRAQADANLLQEAKRLETGNPNAIVQPWDVEYYMTKCEAIGASQRCIHTSNAPAYFPFESCLEGLGNLFCQLFGLHLVEETPQKEELWHPSVRKIRVEHEDEGFLGYILGDFFHHNLQAVSNCHFTLRGGRQLVTGAYQSPVIAVCCDVPHSSTTVLSLYKLDNIWHEFGHALHSMLGRTRYQQVTGTRCTLDFAEIPSTLNEIFVNDPRVMKTVAKHHRTGEPVADSTLEAIVAQKKMFASYELQVQILHAAFDVCLHMGLREGQSALDLWHELHERFVPVPVDTSTAWFLHFGHLHTYGGMYFSYLWARAVATLLWKECFHGNPFSREMGERYRETMLSHGGEFPASQLVASMLGYEPTINDLVSALVKR